MFEEALNANAFRRRIGTSFDASGVCALVGARAYTSLYSTYEPAGEDLAYRFPIGAGAYRVDVRVFFGVFK